MRVPSAWAIVAFLAFAVEEIAAQDFKDELKQLPVCAQFCIASTFSTCKCKNLDFTCPCTCKTYRGFSEQCATASCGGAVLKTLLDQLDSSCKAINDVAASLSSSKSTLPTSTSSALNTQAVSIPALTTGLSSPLTPLNPSGSLGAGIPGTISRPQTRIVVEDSSLGVGFSNTDGFSPATATPPAASQTAGTTTPSLYDYSLTTSLPQYPYCSQSYYYVNGTANYAPIMNGTAGMWNGSANCTGFPSEFIGGAAMLRRYEGFWVAVVGSALVAVRMYL